MMKTILLPLENGDGLRAMLDTAWLAALLPRGVMTSQLGRVDHHVAEALTLALLGLGSIYLLPLYLVETAISRPVPATMLTVVAVLALTQADPSNE